MNLNEEEKFVLLYVIANYGYGSAMLHLAKQEGISGGTIMLGKGTVNNRILEFLGLSETRKEIVLMGGSEPVAYRAIDALNKRYDFTKPNHGIAFTTSLKAIIGTRKLKFDDIHHEKGEYKHMYHLITAVVDKGLAEDVIEAATAAGSKGGTIINARGSGIHETSRVFAMDIEPEKEIVLILSEVELTEPIVASIRQNLQMDKPGNGIIYVQDVDKTFGLYK